MASVGEANLLRLSRGILPVLPGMNGPVNTRRMEEFSLMMETFRDALVVEDGAGVNTAVESSGGMKENRNRIARMPPGSRGGLIPRAERNPLRRPILPGTREPHTGTHGMHQRRSCGGPRLSERGGGP